MLRGLIADVGMERVLIGAIWQADHSHPRARVLRNLPSPRHHRGLCTGLNMPMYAKVRSSMCEKYFRIKCLINFFLNNELLVMNCYAIYHSK